MTPPRHDLPPLHSWSQRRPLRRIIQHRSGFQSWPFELPDAIEGSGDATEYSTFVDLPSPGPIGSGLFGAPGLELFLAQGGTLDAALQFWGPGIYLTGAGSPTDGIGCDGDYYINLTDMEYWGPKGDDTAGSWSNTGPVEMPSPEGDGKWLFGLGPPSDATGADEDYYLDQKDWAWYGPKAEGSWESAGPNPLPDPDDALVSDVSIQSLATPQPTAYVVDGTGNTEVPASDETGTFYSDWSTLVVPIPACTAYLFAFHGYFNAGPLNPETVYPPYNHFVHYTLHFEFGDEDENVIGSVEIASHDWQYDTFDNVSQSVVAAFKSGQSITLASEAVKKRAKMVVTENHYCRPYTRLLAGARAEVL